MCGIAGCVGHESATEFVTESLETLEYRGYDSIGIAFQNAAVPSLEVIKSLGGAANLRAVLPNNSQEATSAIGHTRWATTGEVTEHNAHPHTNEDGTIAVVHNGAIENYAELKKEITDKGYGFSSETDTEVVPHLIDYYRKEGASAEDAFEQAMKRLEGAYAILSYMSDKPGTLYAARVGSPLVLGVNGKEHFAASDPSVLTDHTKEAVFLDDYEMAILSPKGYRIKSLSKGISTTRPPEEISDVFEKATLGEFPHYMLKEIYDSPDTVRAAISGRVFPDRSMLKLGGLEDKKEELRNIDRLIIVGCGTSYHAGLVGERLIEEVAGIPVEVDLASEFKYSNEPFEANTAVIAISQSGETADTIGALEKAKDFGMLKLGVINSPGSTIDRVTDAGVHCRAGKEISVASTKAFTSQVTVLAEIALAIGKVRNENSHAIMQELTNLPGKIEELLEDTTAIQIAAKKYAHYKNFLYMGRGYEYPSALEGALKLKEISYINANGISAGEMKHGTLALIDEDFPTMAIATNGSVLDKTLSNIEEIKARKGPVITLANRDNEKIEEMVKAGRIDDVIYVPSSLEQTQPILNGIALQLFAYYVAAEKGEAIDRPRNLAKSVTVE